MLIIRFVVLLFLTSCAITGYVTAPPVQYGAFDVYFCPVEDCESVWVQHISDASVVQCAFYDLELENLTAALVNADVLVFEDNFVDFGTPVGSSGLMHHKFCVLDGRKVIAGSMNPTFNGAYRNDNNVLVIEGSLLAENYLAEWEALQGGQEKTPHKVVEHHSNRSLFIENYFCPRDDCENEILSELSVAKSSIHFMVFTFTSDPIGDLLVAKHAQGLTVSGVMEKRQNSQYAEYEKLLSAGINVVWDANPQTMHHKVFIIDNKTVITGSYNPTKAANTRNEENILIIHDKEIAKEFLEEFARVRHDTLSTS